MGWYRMPLAIIGLSIAVGCSVGDDNEKFTISKEAQQIIKLTNEARAKEKLPPLKPHPLLFKSAKVTGELCAKQKKSAHIIIVNGKETTPGDRIDDVKYDWEACGENITEWDKLSPEKAVQRWLDSRVHREEIMTKEYDEIGIGIVRGNGIFYYVQHFGKRRTKPE